MDICDFHSHILHKVDHGSDSLSTTLQQLRLAKLHNVTRVFATSHFYPHVDSVDSFLERRNSSYEELSLSLSDEYPKIKLGAEILLCPGIENLPDIDKLCVSGTDVLLTELPFSDFSQSYVNSVFSLISKGYKVVLAHPERYNSFNIVELLNVGALLQVNAKALCGFFLDKDIRSWIKAERVVAIGSDIHGVDKRAYSEFELAIKKMGEYAKVVQAFSDSIWQQAK